METPLTLNNARVVRELLIFFSKLYSGSKIILGCYIVKTASVASNDAPYER